MHENSELLYVRFIRLGLEAEPVIQAVDIVKVDLLLVRKISKRHFLRDIGKSFQEVTPMGPEPHQFFSF